MVTLWIIKKEYLKYENFYKRSQDLDLYLRLISSGKKITNINKVLSYVFFDPTGISINQKPSQLRYICRAHHNFECRKNNIKENKKLIKDSSMLDLLWKFAKPLYKIYLRIDLKKYKLLKIILLSFCLIIYPPLIIFYIFRINIINKFRLYIYSILKFFL